MIRQISYRLSLPLRLCVSLLLFVSMSQSVASAADTVTYEGPWHTINRKLDGTMTCIVTRLDGERWQGRFYGTWQGVNFDHTVPFTGPPDDLHGAANIDGADYQWTGKIASGSPATFKGNFGGTRYNGYFDLKETQRTAVRPKSTGQ